MPARYKRHKRLYHNDASIIRLKSHFPNDIWSIDFAPDKLSNGRPFKFLSFLEEYTRDAFAVTLTNKMGSSDVLKALYPLLMKREKPGNLRSDKGTKFTSKITKDSLNKVGVRATNI